MGFLIRPPKPVLTNRVLYPATIENLISEPSKFQGGKDRLKWSFVITLPDRPECDYEVTAWTPITFFQGQPPHTWASAALGHTLGTDEEVEMTDLIGATVQLRVTSKAGNQGTIYYNVEAVLPPASSEDSESGMLATPATPEEDVPFDRF